jgi:hypothetical protein
LLLWRERFYDRVGNEAIHPGWLAKYVFATGFPYSSTGARRVCARFHRMMWVMLERSMKKTVAVESASALIDAKINELGGWRGKTLAKVRAIIHKAEPEIVEEWKWMGTPVFSHGGIVCTGETYKNVVKLTFAKGADLCQGSCVEGPFRSIQLQPRGKCQARHRHPRRREDR